MTDYYRPFAGKIKVSQYEMIGARCGGMARSPCSRTTCGVRRCSPTASR
jgi:hypothetical protein